MQRSMARNNVKLMPRSADDKPQLLRKLQGRPHFETTLTATTASRYGKSSGLTVPSWFVQEHGDKFRQSAILRTESSTIAWPVAFGISFYSRNSTQVRFSGGWKAFSASNGLLEGDSLVFALMAMSTFKVYVFRSIEGPFPSRTVQRKLWTSDNSDRARKKAKQSDYECKDEQLQVAADDAGSDVQGTNGVLIARRKTVADEVAASAFAQRRPPSFRNSCRRTDLHLLPSSWIKTLTACNVRHRGGDTSLEFPVHFWKTYGSRIHSVVKLQGIREESPVRTMACHTSPSCCIRGQPLRHYLRAGWRAFVKENRLQVGQQLLFTLAADSFFIVREALRAPS